MFELLGMKVKYSIRAANKNIVDRTWKERLFSLPFRPFEKTKIVYEPTIWFLGNTLLVHPTLKQKIEYVMQNEHIWTHKKAMSYLKGMLRGVG